MKFHTHKEGNKLYFKLAVAVLPFLEKVSDFYI
jgi:hypothetical protein